ncbi:uncharacterized protein LOC128951233 [Oppia nitens]|uniref:uncharacterized protein LOC128951233 n=1 Tax=Oppia nitens TaxID=1686743 RepID=UPI0023DB2BF5|nr:uncharacterized protein LOC128951233 [Oppia nitens]
MNTKPEIQNFDGLPQSIVLPKTGQTVIFDVYRPDKDFQDLYEIWWEVIDKGQSYLQYTTNEQEFQEVFVSKSCFVFRLMDNNKTIGAFHLKPSAPGRASHTGCYERIVHKDYRNIGLGGLMLDMVDIYAPLLGYKSLIAYVFATNDASIATNLKKGLVQTGCIPRAVYLKAFGFTDTLIFHKSLTND